MFQKSIKIRRLFFLFRTALFEYALGFWAKSAKKFVIIPLLWIFATFFATYSERENKKGWLNNHNTTKYSDKTIDLINLLCSALAEFWSEWQDSNLRHRRPKRRALPTAPHPDNGSDSHILVCFILRFTIISKHGEFVKIFRGFETPPSLIFLNFIYLNLYPWPKPWILI